MVVIGLTPLPLSFIACTCGPVAEAAAAASAAVRVAGLTSGLEGDDVAGGCCGDCGDRRLPPEFAPLQPTKLSERSTNQKINEDDERVLAGRLRIGFYLETSKSFTFQGGNTRKTEASSGPKSEASTRFPTD